MTQPTKTGFHKLKIHPEHLEALQSGAKTFEIRRNDRGYEVGCILDLREWCPVKEDYTWRELMCRVTYMTDYEQKPGFVVLGIKLM